MFQTINRMFFPSQNLNVLSLRRCLISAHLKCAGSISICQLLELFKCSPWSCFGCVKLSKANDMFHNDDF